MGCVVPDGKEVHEIAAAWHFIVAILHDACAKDGRGAHTASDG